jgi:hypothetical protein
MARIWWVVSADRGSNGNAACHPNKERDSRGCGKINSLGTWWKNVEGWGSPRKKKLAHDGYCGHFDFGYLKMQRMSAHNKKKKKLHRIEYWH